VVLRDGKPRALDGEHPDQILEPVLDPLLAMFASLSAQERAADASGNAMIPMCNRLIDDGPWRGHECRLHIVREPMNTYSVILEPGVGENSHREAIADIPVPPIIPNNRAWPKLL
jgi:hypothetical protein